MEVIGEQCKWMRLSANEKLLIKTTTQLKLNAEDNSVEWRRLRFDSGENFTSYDCEEVGEVFEEFVCM